MIRTTSAVFAALALSACASEIGYQAGDRAGDPGALGNAVLQNIAAQTVNPEGSSADVVASGARANRAVQAYANDKVEKPIATATTRAGAASECGLI